MFWCTLWFLTIITLCLESYIYCRKSFAENYTFIINIFIECMTKKILHFIKNFAVFIYIFKTNRYFTKHFQMVSLFRNNILLWPMKCFLSFEIRYLCFQTRQNYVWVEVLQHIPQHYKHQYKKDLFLYTFFNSLYTLNRNIGFKNLVLNVLHTVTTMNMVTFLK